MNAIDFLYAPIFPSNPWHGVLSLDAIVLILIGAEASMQTWEAI
ncbi:MAG: hypothetical protein ACXWTK_05555 [Methylobacter sp.]